MRFQCSNQQIKLELIYRPLVLRRGGGVRGGREVQRLKQAGYLRSRILLADRSTSKNLKSIWDIHNKGCCLTYGSMQNRTAAADPSYKVWGTQRAQNLEFSHTKIDAVVFDLVAISVISAGMCHKNKVNSIARLYRRVQPKIVSSTTTSITTTPLKCLKTLFLSLFKDSLFTDGQLDESFFPSGSL